MASRKPLLRVALVDSKHCYRYNTRTGRPTRPMLDAVFERLDTLLLA